MKKISSLLFFLLLSSCSFINPSTNSNSEEINKKLQFELTDKKDGYRLIGYIGNDVEVVVPNQYKGLPVLEINEGVFNDCGNMQKITLPFIGASAKDYNNEKDLFGYIFGTVSYENGLLIEQSYLYNREIQYYKCYIPKSLFEVVISNGETKINDYAFLGCKSLTSISIPNSITSIGKSAFSVCHSLTTIEIPNSVTSIKDNAFYNCGSLNSIVIPNSVISIGAFAFSLCRNLTSVTFEEESKLTNIMYDAFSECKSLKFNEYGNCLYLGSVENPYFLLIKPKDTNIIESSINANTRIIMPSAFHSCTFFRTLIIPNSVTRIGDEAFHNCFYLTIYCEANSKPSGWSSSWKDLDCQVYWAGQWSYIDGIPTPNK